METNEEEDISEEDQFFGPNSFCPLEVRESDVVMTETMTQENNSIALLKLIYMPTLTSKRKLTTQFYYYTEVEVFVL